METSPPLTRDVLTRLRQIPQSPTRMRHIKHVPFLMRGFSDYVVHAPQWLSRARAKVVSYPAPFRKARFKSWDGVELTAWLGIHRAGSTKKAPGRPEPREGILLVPGMFTTKDNALFRRRALRFFQEWGYHVLVLDLRGMGESMRVLNTCGWKESEDVEAALEFFRAHAPLEKVHIYAESLGAVASIRAAARQAERGFRLLDGAILAISPYPKAARMIRHLTHAPTRFDAVFITQWFFAQLLHLGGRHFKDFEAYLRHAAKEYGVTPRQLYARSDAVPAIRKVNVPLLAVVSDDDPLVPRGEMRLFVNALRGRSNPAVLRLPWGSHALYEELDPRWFWDLVHEFFDFYCVLPRR